MDNKTIKCVNYLKETYNPISIIVYGSYALGTNDESSDFDCMVIVDSKEVSNDTSVVNGVQLDCYIYTRDEINNLEIDTFATLFNPIIVFDTDNIGERLVHRVKSYIKDNSKLSKEKKQFLKDWVAKQIGRVQKEDEEGKFRAVMLLNESLSVYSSMRDMFYLGSKQTIKYIKENDEIGYNYLLEALNKRDNESIINWAQYCVLEGVENEI